MIISGGDFPRWDFVRRGCCPIWLCPEGSLSDMIMSGGDVVRYDFVRRGCCPIGLCPEGILADKIISGWDFVRQDYVRRECCPIGLCPEVILFLIRLRRISSKVMSYLLGIDMLAVADWSTCAVWNRSHFDSVGIILFVHTSVHYLQHSSLSHINISKMYDRLFLDGIDPVIEASGPRVYTVK